MTRQRTLEQKYTYFDIVWNNTYMYSMKRPSISDTNDDVIHYIMSIVKEDDRFSESESYWFAYTLAKRLDNTDKKSMDNIEFLTKSIMSDYLDFRSKINDATFLSSNPLDKCRSMYILLIHDDFKQPTESGYAAEVKYNNDSVTFSYLEQYTLQKYTDRVIL